MLLTLDIGNTNITTGIFNQDKLQASWRIATDTRKTSDEYMTLLWSLFNLTNVPPQTITDAVICSVVPPLTTTFSELCSTYLQISPLIVGSGIKTGVRILYDSPRDVGADRVVDAAAAFRIYGGPVVIVDFGTATVFDAVTREGGYLGGAIAPGINLSADALFTGTSQLRRVELTRPKSAVGQNNIEALQSGLVLGHISMVEGMISLFKQEIGADARCVATGGHANLIAQGNKIFDAINPDLTLMGLRMIYNMNRSMM